MRRLIVAAAVVTAVLAAGGDRAGAQGIVNQPAPELSAQHWANSPPLTLKALRGRIVVVEFWATWCGPCRESTPHLVALYKKYAAKGVVVIGLTDESKVKAEPFVRDMAVPYPVGFGSPSARVYGVNAIPHAFIVDPRGVLTWKGHPMSGLDEAIEKQLKLTPPQLLSGRDRDAALATVSKADEAMKKEQYRTAAAILRQAKDLDGDPEVKAKADEIRTALVAIAAGRMLEVDGLVEDKKYYEASVALGDVVAFAPGSENATKAAARLKELTADKAIAAAIAKGVLEARAADALAQLEKEAAKMPSAKRLAALKDLAKQYPGTRAGKDAADKAQAIRDDKTVMANMANADAEKDCKGWLSMARNFINAGMNDKARPYLERVIKQYPDTAYATKAGEMLAEMAK